MIKKLGILFLVVFLVSSFYSYGFKSSSSSYTVIAEITHMNESKSSSTTYTTITETNPLLDRSSSTSYTAWLGLIYSMFVCPGRYDIGGEVAHGSCCGDMPNQYVVSCSADSGAVCDGTTACCDASSDCVFNDFCNSDLTANNTNDASLDLEVCSNGVWKDYDSSSSLCSSGGYHWLSNPSLCASGSCDDYDGMGAFCCGDEPTEGYTICDPKKIHISNPDANESLSGWFNYTYGNCAHGNFVDVSTSYYGNFTPSFHVYEGSSSMWPGTGVKCKYGIAKKIFVPWNTTEFKITAYARGQSGYSGSGVTQAEAMLFTTDDQYIYGEKFCSNGYTCGDTYYTLDFLSDPDVQDFVKNGGGYLYLVLGIGDGWSANWHEQAWFDDINITINGAACSSFDESCCDSNGACVMSGTCYANNTFQDVNSDTYKEYCYNGDWFQPDEYCQYFHYFSGTVYDEEINCHPWVNWTYYTEYVYVNDNLTINSSTKTRETENINNSLWIKTPSDINHNYVKFTSCNNNFCYFTHNYTNLGTYTFYVNATDFVNQTNLTDTKTIYIESLTVDELNYENTSYFNGNKFIWYGDNLNTTIHIKNDRTNLDSPSTNFWLIVYEPDNSTPTTYNCSLITSVNGKATCNFTNFNLPKKDVYDYDYTICVNYENATDIHGIKNNERNCTIVKVWENMNVTRSISGETSSITITGSVLGEKSSVASTCSNCVNVTIEDSDGINTTKTINLVSGAYTTNINSKPLKRGYNKVYIFADFKGNGTNYTSIFIGGNVKYNISKDVFDKNELIEIYVNSTSRSNITLSNVWVNNSIFYGVDTNSDGVADTLGNLKLSNLSIGNGLLHNDESIVKRFVISSNEFSPGEYAILPIFGDDGTNYGVDYSWNGRVASNVSSLSWSLLPKFKVYELSSMTWTSDSEINRGGTITIYVNATRNEGYGKISVCGKDITCNTNLTIYDRNGNVLITNQSMTWTDGTYNTFSYSYTSYACGTNNYTIRINDSYGLITEVNGSYFVNCSLYISNVFLMQGSNSKDLSSGDTIDKSKGDLNFGIDVFDPFGADNVSYVNASIYDKLTSNSLFYGTISNCNNQDAYTKRCYVEISNSSVDCHNIQLDVYANDTLNSKEDSTSLVLKVDALQINDLVYKDEVLVGSEESISGKVSYCSGKTDLSNVLIHLYLSSLGYYSTPVDNDGRFEINYEASKQGNFLMNLIANDTNLKSEVDDIIKVSSSELYVSPSIQTLSLGSVGDSAYKFVVNNPSDKDMKYKLEITQTEIPVRFSRNQEKEIEIDVDSSSNYTGTLDVLPVRAGVSDTVITLVNVYHPNDNDTASVKTQVYALYSSQFFKYTLVPDVELFNIVFALLIAILIYIKI